MTKREKRLEWQKKNHIQSYQWIEKEVLKDGKIVKVGERSYGINDKLKLVKIPDFDMEEAEIVEPEKKVDKRRKK